MCSLDSATKPSASRSRTSTSSGNKAEAIAAVPLAMVEDVALVGPLDKIKAELPRWKETCMTTMLVSAPAPMLPAMAELLSD